MRHICVFVAIVLLISCSSPTSKSGPNIIYILTDDLGYGDVSILNPSSKIPTPNMDQIAANGVSFSDAHSNSSVCTPTRYGVLTGRYAFRSRLKSGVLWGYSSSLIEPERETVASFLKTNGYNTACIGKWHLGLDWKKKDQSKEIPDIKWKQKVEANFDDNVDYSSYISGGPSDHGFDYSFIIPASLDMSPYCYIQNGHVVEEPIGYTAGKLPEDEGRGVFWRTGKMSPSFDFDKVLPAFVDTAAHYISTQAQNEDPFFLYLPLPSPHTPWLPDSKYDSVSGAGKYGDYVAMVDDMIGRLVKEINQAGISHNTLFIVTSDNGADWRPEDIEATDHLANYIYKGRKADIYEAGHRIPFIAQWPGVIPSGIRSDQVMCTTDLFATLAGLLGQELPENNAEDSENLWPAFIGQDHESIRDYTIHHSLDGYFSIRKGKWKYTPHLGSGGFSDPKSIKPEKGEAPGTLYNMEIDVKEENNLYSDYPEVVAELSELLEQAKNQ